MFLPLVKWVIRESYNAVIVPLSHELTKHKVKLTFDPTKLVLRGSDLSFFIFTNVAHMRLQ